MVRIIGTEEGSLCEKRGIRPSDVLISINGNEINDVLDYRFYLAEKVVKLKLERAGAEFEITIRKGVYDDIGLIFESALMDEKHSCRNGCIFCFIDQNPKGLRESLYFKDDDSRLSFIHGNYVTLTNMTDKDIDRIIKMRISPINVSIHTTNPELRVRMMKNKRSGEVLDYLRRFKEAGLSMCGQIVLCKGVNDGEELLRSMRDLSAYFPELGSVSIVPAGLTKYRDKLYPLSDFTKEEAGAVIDMIDAFSEEHLRSRGSRLFFAADELYLKAGRELPPEEYYEGYPQIENGVGMIRSFTEEFSMGRSDASDMTEALGIRREVSVATGVASYPMILNAAERIMDMCPNLRINVYRIINNFFGESITVSGLLTGKDMLEQLSDKRLGEELFIPENCLKADEDIFLCGMSLEQLAEALGVRISVSENDGYEFVRNMLGIRDEDEFE